MSEQQEPVQIRQLKVPCRQCKGVGMQIINNALAVCGQCQGLKEVLVRDVDPCWSMEIQDSPNSKKRTIMMVTWGGRVEFGTPLTQNELMWVSRNGDPLIAGVMILASQNALLRKRVEELERRNHIHVEDD